MSPILVGIITVSDRCFNMEASDSSGPNLKIIISNDPNINAEVVRTSIVPDDVPLIQEEIRRAVSLNLDLILTTGGTGFSPRDVTPEATQPLLDKSAPGLVAAMLVSGLSKTPHAALSRGVSGIINQTLVINLPGSKKGSEESLVSIIKVLPHAISLLRDHKPEITSQHNAIQNNSSSDEVHTKVVKGGVADRLRSSPYPMITVKQAQKIVLEHVIISDGETIPFTEGLGRVLCEPVVAPDALPPFPASIKDGYAVIAADGKGLRKVIGTKTAGDETSSLTLTNGVCYRINTGAPVPLGADAVVQVEDTVLHEAADGEERAIKILTTPVVGQDIRPVGSDIQAGAVVLPAHLKLTSSEIGLLAAVGALQIKVYKQPRVGIVSTGNELQEPNEILKNGKIRDSNRTTLKYLLKENGFETMDLGIANDEPESLFQSLRKAFKDCDYVITSGCVSMGEKDILKDVLIEDFGAQIHFGRVNMKPGKPTMFATFLYDGHQKTVFGLPGNPVSCLVTSHLYVIPALKKAIGVPRYMPTIIQAKVTDTLKLDFRPEYHRAVLSWSDKDEVLPYAASTGNQISSRLLSCTAANSLLLLPAKSDYQTEIVKDTVVNAMIIGSI